MAAVVLTGAGGALAAFLPPGAPGGRSIPMTFRAIAAAGLLLLPLGLAHLATRWMGRRWTDYGIGRPDRWGRTLVRALLTVGAVFLTSALVIEPLRSLLQLPTADLGVLDPFRGDLRAFVALLAAAWTTAALGEELLFRGFLLNELAELAGGGGAGWSAAAVLTSVLFGVGHFYQGPGGMLSTGVVGLVLAAAYLLSGRNLWVPVLGHGLLDTVSLTALFLG